MRDDDDENDDDDDDDGFIIIKYNVCYKHNFSIISVKCVCFFVENFSI
jgi:hypothetical protein